MKNVKIITDGCSDIPEEWQSRYDIGCVPLSFGSGAEAPYVFGDGFSEREFYDAMRNGETVKPATTSAAAFEAVFGKYSEDNDIVYIGCSSALSDTFSVGAAVADRLKNDGSAIYCVDTKAACGAQSLLAVEAAKLAGSGMTAEEIAARIAKLAPHARQVATADTLEYLKRAGRVRAASAFFGNLFGIKPILMSDVFGMSSIVKKAKGRRNALDESVELLKKTVCYADNPVPVSEQTVYIGHADCAEDAEYCAERVMSELAPKSVFINSIGPVIGSMTGPTTVALFAFGRPVDGMNKNIK